MRIRMRPGCEIITLEMEENGEYEVSTALGAALCEIGLAEPVRDRREVAVNQSRSQAVEVRDGG